MTLRLALFVAFGVTVLELERDGAAGAFAFVCFVVNTISQSGGRLEVI